MERNENVFLANVLLQLISVAGGRFPRASAKPPRPHALPPGSRLSRFSRWSRRLPLQSLVNILSCIYDLNEGIRVSNTKEKATFRSKSNVAFFNLNTHTNFKNVSFSVPSNYVDKLYRSLVNYKINCRCILEFAARSEEKIVTLSSKKMRCEGFYNEILCEHSLSWDF